MAPDLEPCPGCGALLPPVDGPTHRYIGAFPASIQSVAVHLLALHSMLERGVDPGKALWVRLRAVRERAVFRWLDPPGFRETLTVVQVAREAPNGRGARMAEYVVSVYKAWAAVYGETIAAWYGRFVERD